MSRFAELERAVLARNGRRSGGEIWFGCLFPENHNHGDARPSAKFNPEKGAWYCTVCKKGGGAKELAELLGVGWSADREIVASYAYTDEDGELLYEVVRLTRPKDFWQRRPDGKGGWTWKTKGVRRVIYRLREVLAALLVGRTIFIVEGEKDADALASLELVATTNAGGAGKWLKSCTDTLRGARVVILPDNDKVGFDHAQLVAGKLHGVAEEVRVLELPDLPASGDVSNWIANRSGDGRTADQIREELEALVAAAPLWEPPAEPSDDQSGQLTQSQLLIQLAEPAGLFHTADRDGYAVFPVGDHRETWPLKSRSFRRWLLHRFYRKVGKPPGSQALQDAIETLHAQADAECEQHPVFVRVAETDGAIYLDLANDRWEVVEITASGYRVITDPPVRFRRSKAMLPLPKPERGGSVAELRRFINVRGRRAFILLLGWLVAALRPQGPFTILIIQGEQGTAKSSLARLLRALVDPVRAPLRTAPSSERDLAIAAANSWCVAYDNLSGLPPWLADALCRLATGGGLSTRQLYSDDEETIFEVQRPAILTGIAELASRQDLTDRAVILHLETIDEVITERQLRREFEEARPRILGALCDAVASALGRVETVTLPVVPGMADFAEWATAAESGLGLPDGAFLDAYLENRGEAIELALESDLVAVAVQALAAHHRQWSGTATALLEELGKFMPETARRSKYWPKAAGPLSGRLKRAATFLRAVGIEVHRARDSERTRTKLLTIRCVERPNQGSADATAAPRTQLRTQGEDGNPLEERELDAADAADAVFGAQSKASRVRVEI